jgi:hypothetical protein
VIRILALAASALWGYAEATVFFIVPDVAIGLIALGSWRRGVESAFAACAGALLGGVEVFGRGAAYRERLLEVPGISRAMLDDASARFARQGWYAVVRAPLDGIPYKVYATEAAARGRSLEELVLVTPPARLWRFLLVAGGAAAGGAVARRMSVRRWSVVALYGLVWVATYVSYYLQLRRRYGHQR